MDYFVLSCIKLFLDFPFFELLAYENYSSSMLPRQTELITEKSTSIQSREYACVYS
jgi:hypothetical protein